jgi:DNA-directed RNA polymerase subunit M/transcription elongation factor TFIIS
MTTQQQTAQRVALNLQCRECYGVRVDAYASRFGGNAETRFECRECGYTWHGH